MTTDNDAACWLCGRTLGVRVQWHHIKPKSRGGRDVEPVHPICHRAIHEAFTNAELDRLAGSGADLKTDPRLARFLDWIAGKSPDFHAPTRRRKPSEPESRAKAQRQRQKSRHASCDPMESRASLY